MAELTSYEEKVEWFAHQMIESLEVNDRKGGWDQEDRCYLLRRLREEADELQDALINGDRDYIVREASDVANFAMMIADVAVNAP